jgi:hypothetical protein
MGIGSDFSIMLGISFALCASFLFPCAEAAQSPPHFTSTPPAEAAVGESYVYDANATDPDNDPLTYYLPVVKPDNMTIDYTSGYIVWTPTNVGLQTIIVWVTDGNFQVDQCFTVNVTPPKNSPPNITSTPPTQAYVGQKYVYYVKAVDPDGDRVYYFLDQKPPGMTIGEQSGTVNWTPPVELADQSLPVLVRVLDAADHAATQYFAIRVTKPVVPGNHAPVVVGTDVTNATQDSLYFYALAAVDSDGDSLTFCITLGPPGMSIDSSSGVITWTPTGADVRVWEVRVAVSDGKTSISHDFSLNVRSRNPVHYNEDPAKPATSPEVLCLILPAMSVIILVILRVARPRRSQ